MIDAMSAIGTKRTFALSHRMSAFGVKADIILKKPDIKKCLLLTESEHSVRLLVASAAMLSPTIFNRGRNYPDVGINPTCLPFIGIAIGAVRIREVDPRAKRIGRSAPGIVCWHARRIGHDTTVFLHRSLGMCARQVP